MGVRLAPPLVSLRGASGRVHHPPRLSLLTCEVGLVAVPRVTGWLWGFDEMIHVNYRSQFVPNRRCSVKGVAVVMRDSFHFLPFLHTASFQRELELEDNSRLEWALGAHPG